MSSNNKFYYNNIETMFYLQPKFLALASIVVVVIVQVASENSWAESTNLLQESYDFVIGK